MIKMKLAFLHLVLTLLGPASLLAQTADNPEILRMYEEDQTARKAASINWVQLNKEDSLRRKKVTVLLDSSKVVTGKDFYHSAMIFQHGTDTLASSIAINLMKKALDLDSTVDKWLLAAAIDRHLMRKELPQIYGTQYVKMSPNDKWQRYQIDSTKVTDQERMAFNVETLAEQKEKERRMNLRTISQQYQVSKSTNKMVKLIRTELAKGTTSQYDVSEDAVDSFGYELFEKPEEAVKIFKLNTELYPEGFNTFDSYGECLYRLNRKAEAITAFNKSLELNPENTHAKALLLKLQAR